VCHPGPALKTIRHNELGHRPVRTGYELKAESFRV
jgi:hypothetical protein